MADPVLTASDYTGPDINAKSIIDNYDNKAAFSNLSALQSNGWSGNTIDYLAGAGSMLGNNDALAAAKYFQSKGLGGLTGNDIIAKQNDAKFISNYKLGTTKSLVDYVKQYAATNPSFDIKDQNAVNELAQQIGSRGLNPVTQKQDVQNFITTAATSNALQKAQNPQNYLTPEQTSTNQTTAQRLVSSLFPSGDNTDLTSYVTKLLGQGQDPYTVSQFLQTTPQFMKQQSDQQAAQQNTQIQSAQQALNNTLQQSQQQVFEKATPNIISSFMRAGRLNSSGLQSALAQAQAQLDQQRQSQLATAGYAQAATQQGYNQQNFLNQQAQAYQNYAYQNAPSYNQQFNLQNASNAVNYQQPFNQQNYLNQLNTMGVQQQYALQNYNLQQSDYERYLQQARQYQNQNILPSLAGSALQGLASGGFKF